MCPWREGDRQGRNEGKEREREEGRGKRKKRGRKEGEGEGGRGRVEERETKQNTTLLCYKNGQLTYNIRNLILLPSSSIIIILKSIPGEAEGRKRGRKNEECGSNESRWAENRITTNIPLIIRTK